MKHLLSSLALSAVLSSLFLAASCETDSAGATGKGIKVSPSYTKVNSGESVALTASGGYSYSWKLSNPEIGSLSGTVGASVVYTAQQPGEATQTITVTSGYNAGAGEKTAGTGTNTVTQTTSSTLATASAIVYHRAPVVETNTVSRSSSSTTNSSTKSGDE